MSVERDVFQFLEEAIALAGASAGTVALVGLEVNETVYQLIKTDRGVRVGDGESQLAPVPGGERVDEFDCFLSVICFARVTGADKTDRVAAREDAIDIGRAVSLVFLADPSMNGRVRDSRVLRARRGFDSTRDRPTRPSRK